MKAKRSANAPEITVPTAGTPFLVNFANKAKNRPYNKKINKYKYFLYTIKIINLVLTSFAI